MSRSLVTFATLMYLSACGSTSRAPTSPEAAPPAAAAPAAPAQVPAGDPVGIWLGALEVGGSKLRLAFHVERAADGALRATLDSLDQGVSGIPFDKASYQAPTLRLELAQLKASFEGKVEGDKLVGSWSQGAALPLAMARVDHLEAAAPKRPQQPARPFPYREEEVTISVHASADRASKETIKLAGTLSLPEGKGPFPAVVLVTGSGTQDRDETLFGHKPFLVLSDALVRRGIATLRLDDRGTGASEGVADSGTTLVYADNVATELEWLAARPEIDKRAIGVVGHSEGALIAPIVASLSKRARFLVMLAGPGVRGDQILIGQAERAARMTGGDDAKTARDRADAENLFTQLRLAKTDDEARAAMQAFVEADPSQKAEREANATRFASRLTWLRAFLGLDPIPYLTKVRIPVLAIAGELDIQVTKDNLPLIEAALRRAKNPDATAKLLPSLNHLFQHAKTGSPAEYAAIEETFAPEALQLISDWIVERATRLRR